MGKIDKQRLVRMAATGAGARGGAPIPNLRLARRWLAKNGEIISGANVESASYV